MFKIMAGAVCMYYSTATDDKYKIINPSLTLSKNSAGTLTFTMPPCNNAYKSLTRLQTSISVERDGVEIWAGRVLDEKKDFWNNRIITCEGALSFLNDTYQEPAKYTNVTVKAFLTALLNQHNTKTATTNQEKRQIYIGNVVANITDANGTSSEMLINATTNFERTLDCINNSLLQNYGGSITITRNSSNQLVLNYYDDSYTNFNTSTQTIEFGKNLLNFTKQWDSTQYASVIIPRGCKLTRSAKNQNGDLIKGLEAYLGVEGIDTDSDHHEAGSFYVTAFPETISQRGWIEQVVDFGDVRDENKLLDLAVQYLEDTQFDNLTLEVSAADLHYLDKNINPINFMDKVVCTSEPHQMHHTFLVSKVTIPLDHPENTTYTLGDKIQVSLTSSTKKANDSIVEKVKEMPIIDDVLESAKQKAHDIMELSTTGYITTTHDSNGNSNALYISDTNDLDNANHYWKWNINGLAYYDKTNPMYQYDENNNVIIDETGGNQLKLAITMDGGIVADYITTGQMSANRVRTGILSSTTVDNNGNPITSFDLNTGELKMTKGEINLGDGNFVVSSDGTLTAKTGTFSGDISGATGIFKGGMNVNNGKFIVNSYGDVTVSGDIDLSDGTISWGDNEPITEIPEKLIKLSDDYLDLDGSDVTIINSISMTSPYISGGRIIGGKFYATGLGGSGGSAYYIYNDDDMIGYISYDTNGGDTTYEAKNRVFITTVNDGNDDPVALKIQSSGNMSLEADGGLIYIHTKTHFGGKILVGTNCYGSSLPSDGTYGQLFFKTS